MEVLGHLTYKFRLNGLRPILFAVITLAFGSSCKPTGTNEAAFQRIAAQIQSGDYEDAREAARKAWQRQPSSKWGFRFKSQYVHVLLYQGQTADAARLLAEPLPADSASLGTRYQYLKAYLAYLQKEQAASQHLAQSTLDMATAEGDYELQVEALLLLANQAASNGQKVSLLNTALQTAEQHHLEFQSTTTLLSLGYQMYSLGKYSEAISDYLRASATAQKIHARFLIALLQDNTGLCYLNLGDLDQALQSFTAARSLLVQNDPPSIVSDVNMQLGKIALLRRDNAEAIQYFRQAFASIASRPTFRGYVPAVQRLAGGLIEAGQLDEAEAFNERGKTVLSQYPSAEPFQIALYYLNRADIADRRGQTLQAAALYRQVLQTSKNNMDELEWSAHARLAAIDERLNQPAEARKHFESALVAIEKNRSQQKATDHQITFLSSLIRFYQQYVEFLVHEGNSAEALAVADSSRAAVLTQGQQSSRRTPGFIDLLRHESARSKTAILFYWLAPQQSYVWLITPGGDLFKPLPGEETIAASVNSYSKLIQTTGTDPLTSQNQVGASLFETLVRPLSQGLEKGTRVVIVPDGALHGLNFETLVVKQGTACHYWLDDVTLVVAPSLGILLDKTAATIPSGKALIFGDANYEGDKYQPLPESKKEVADLTTLFGQKNTTLLTQQNATPEAYASAHPESYSYIHFSAHVEANERTPLDSAIILSPGKYGNRQLYARQIDSTPLHANLVTISGCNSVGKKVLAGEGMVGFAWASFHAGARNALTSLWEVDDQSTTELMHNFYTEVQSGSPYDEALQKAKSQMLGKYKKPYYWAPFQLYSRNLGGHR